MKFSSSLSRVSSAAKDARLYFPHLKPDTRRSYIAVPSVSLFTSSLFSPSASVLAQRTQSSLLWIAFNIPDLMLPLQAATRDPR